MCAGPDSTSGGKGARAVDATTQSAIPALAGNPPVTQNPSQRHRRPTADNDARVSRRPSPPGSERSVLVDAGSSIRATAAASPPGRARSSPISTLPRRQSQTHDGLELEGIRRRASNEAAARCEGSDEDSLTCRCPLDTPHKRRRAPSSSDTDDDATDDLDDDGRSPLKRRAAAEALAACPPAPSSDTPCFVRESPMDFASLLSILDDDRDASAPSRQNSSSFADETTHDGSTWTWTTSCATSSPTARDKLASKPPVKIHCLNRPDDCAPALARVDIVERPLRGGGAVRALRPRQTTPDVRGTARTAVGDRGSDVQERLAAGAAGQEGALGGRRRAAAERGGGSVGAREVAPGAARGRGAVLRRAVLSR